VIFSFSETPLQKLNFSYEQTDIFCFFQTDNSIKIPGEFWLHAITTSLKMKKNVLLLEENLPLPPAINSVLRWQVGDEYLWLAPRSLSVLLGAPNTISVSYKNIKNSLLRYK